MTEQKYVPNLELAGHAAKGQAEQKREATELEGNQAEYNTKNAQLDLFKKALDFLQGNLPKGTQELNMPHMEYVAERVQNGEATQDIITDLNKKIEKLKEELLILGEKMAKELQH